MGGGGWSSYRLWLVLKDLPGLLFVAQLLNALSLQVTLLALLKQGVGSPVPPQELGGCAPTQVCEKTHTVHKTRRRSNTLWANLSIICAVVC